MLVPIFFFCTETFASWLYAQDFIAITDFSQDELSWGGPVGWKTHKGICREIRHRIMPGIENRESPHVNAHDNGAILFNPVYQNPKEYLFLVWQWKVSNIIPESREKEVGGDNYPAAVCVVYGEMAFSIPYRYRILIYAYGNNRSAGDRFSNPCESRAKMIVVQRGEKVTGRWLAYKVDITRIICRSFSRNRRKLFM